MRLFRLSKHYLKGGLMDTIKIDSKNTKMIAHRGLSGIECENTAAAFVAAGNRKSYFGIETDVHKTADGNYIIIHDDETGRVAAENLPVEKSLFSDLRKIRLNDKDGKTRGDLCLPTLEEYLRICKKYGKVGVLELKNPFAKQDVENIVATVRAEYDTNQMIFISFDFQNLVFLREIEENAKIQFLCSCEIDMALIEKLGKYNFGIDTYYSKLDESNIRILHSHGIEINCWTVDEPNCAQRLADWGVDYITSDIIENESN